MLSRALLRPTVYPLGRGEGGLAAVTGASAGEREVTFPSLSTPLVLNHPVPLPWWLQSSAGVEVTGWREAEEGDWSDDWGQYSGPAVVLLLTEGVDY